MSNTVNPFIFLPVFILVFSLTVQSTQADVYESVRDPKAKAFGNRVCTNPECTIVAANLINHGNEKIKPCDSFAQFTCDRYRLFRKDTPLRTTSRATNKRLDLLLKAPSTPEDKPYHTLMKTFYDKCVKKDKVKEDPSKTKTAFLAMLDEIGGWPLLNPQNWVAFDESFEEYIANIQKKHDVPILFNAEVMLNYFPVNTDEHMLHLAPAEPIQMPSRHLLALVKSLGFDHPSLAADIDELYSIDTKRQEILDKTTDKTSKWAPLDVVIPKIPNFKIEKYVRHLFDGIAKVNSKTMIAFTNIEYFQKIGTLFTDKRVFANFAIASLFSTKLSASPDTLFCMAQIHELFKYPISQLYVKNHFDRSGIPKVEEMIKVIKEELHEVIEKADWLDDATRSKALKKLAHLRADIGHPENLFDDAFLNDVYNIPPSDPSEDYGALLLRLQRRLHEVELSKISKKLDRITWIHKGTIVFANAMNVAISNTIYISAGILTLPHFSPNLPDYINYAITGMIVAHEIVHGYDDAGRAFDETGDMVDWWDKETADVYKAKSQCFVDQYDKENYDGKKSLGENIADNGGMKLAFKAYKKLMASRGDAPEPALPGFEEFTPEEMFFMAYANTWCNAGPRNPNDEHPPGETRLKVVSQNMKEFSETFACPKKAPMNPDKRCSIW